MGCKSYSLDQSDSEQHNALRQVLAHEGAKIYINASSARVTTPGLFRGVLFRGLKKAKGGDS